MQAENKNYIVAIDLGSGSVTAAAGSKDPDGRLNIIDMVSKPMQGMSCGEVINIEQVTGAVRAAVGELEEHLGIKVTEAYAGISGHDIKCADSSYFVYVSGEDHEICEEDVAKLHESMNSLQPPEGICILDRTPQKYVIDSREETMQPVGRFGQQLEATFNFILANRGSLERLNKAFLRLGIVQRRLFTNAQASAAAVLTEDEKELGAAVIDIGAGCTDICIWQDNIMRYVGVLPVGSDAINRDIRSIAIPERFIEKLKTTHGYAVAAQIPEEKRSQNIKIKGRTQRENKEISFYNLAQIIEARLLDIVENRLVGMKSRGVYETPGGAILYKAIDVLETITLDKESSHFKAQLAQKYADIVYNGQWFTPLREALDAFADSLEKTVTGDVKLKLYKGNMINAGVTSPFTLYDEQTASFGVDKDYDQSDATGFINLFGLSIKERAKLSKNWPEVK